MAQVRVGLVGCGFVAELHMYAYQRVYGLDAQVTAVAARGDHVLDFAKKHQIRRTHRDFKSLLADKEIDVVDICTPNALHATMIVEAMQAGKHVICEKPFTGYFGRGDDKTPIGKHVPKSLMYEPSWRRWTRPARPSNPAAGCSCTRKIGSMRRRWRKPSRYSKPPRTRSCS